MRHDRLRAPWRIDGPRDGVLFRTYIERVLVDELQPADLVICDNLSCHKVRGVAAAIAARGAERRDLPADRPDLNPIEMAFAKLKTLLRARAARTLGDRLRATAKALDAFTPTECLHFLHHAKYATN